MSLLAEWPVGKTLDLVFTIKVGGVLTDASQTPVIRVQDSAHIVTTPGVVRVSLGTYKATIIPDKAGIWAWDATSVNPNQFEQAHFLVVPKYIP